MQQQQQQQQQQQRQQRRRQEEDGEKEEECAESILDRHVGQIRREFEKRRAEIRFRLDQFAKEKAELDALDGQLGDAVVPPVCHAIVGNGALAQDFTKIPSALDAALERLDPEGSLRPSIIRAGKVWSKKSQQGLLGGINTAQLTVVEQKLERNAAMDLLDALTKSGAYGLENAMLHIIVSCTHGFGKNLMDTLVRDNVNPIEKVERSTLIMASEIFGKPAEELVTKK